MIHLTEFHFLKVIMEPLDLSGWPCMMQGRALIGDYETTE